jgi:hypothetical protein
VAPAGGCSCSRWPGVLLLLLAVLLVRPLLFGGSAAPGRRCDRDHGGDHDQHLRDHHGVGQRRDRRAGGRPPGRVQPVGTRYAKVAVDGTSYTATEGQRFADDHRVLDIGGGCATFESGTTRFTLCEDEAVLK